MTSVNGWTVPEVRRVAGAMLFAVLFLGSDGASYAAEKDVQSICERVTESLPQILDPSALGPRRLEHALAPSSWKPTTVTLDGEPMQESDFDFYNDGSIDRVYKIEFNNRYMIGSELLVQHGRSASHLDLVIQNPFEDPDAWLIPCQLAVGDIPLKECPPLSQKNDDASFSASKPGSMTSTIFNVRYTDLEPYRFDNVTYLVAKSFKAGTRRYVAVLKPRSDRMFSYVCLLRHDTAKRKN